MEPGYRDLLSLSHRPSAGVGRWRLAHEWRSSSSRRCYTGMRSGLWAGQSTSYTPNWENHFFVVFVHRVIVRLKQNRGGGLPKWWTGAPTQLRALCRENRQQICITAPWGCTLLFVCLSQTQRFTHRSWDVRSFWPAQRSRSQEPQVQLSATAQLPVQQLPTTLSPLCWCSLLV